MIKKILRRIKFIIKGVINKFFEIIFYIFTNIKNNKIIFINFLGNGYGCNPKYIAKEIINQKLDYDLVWLINNTNEKMPSQIRKVKYESIKALYELATAKVIITNVKNDLRIIKKKEQYVIQTWHASYSLKYVEKDIESKLKKDYRKASIKNSKQTDLFLSNSRLQTEDIKKAFWCNSEILECGYPRNDILFTNDKSIKEKIKNKLNIANDIKVILYTPTFRDNESTKGFSLDCKGLINSLNDNYIILTRMHKNAEDYKNIFESNDKIIDVTMYPDIQELLYIADILITDYSTTMFDFAIMKKRIYLFANDIEEYQSMRGLKPIYFELPFPICKTNKELQEQILNYNEKEYNEKIEKFLNKYMSFDKGDASYKVVERIKKVIGN